jgi:hypothetical protein
MRDVAVAQQHVAFLGHGTPHAASMIDPAAGIQGRCAPPRGDRRLYLPRTARRTMRSTRSIWEDQ